MEPDATGPRFEPTEDDEGWTGGLGRVQVEELAHGLAGRSPDEVKAAFLDRFGEELSDQDAAAISAGRVGRPTPPGA
jgi:hypothetical protein